MQISDNEVKHIAKLARLNLSEEEMGSYKKNLEEILEFADTINHVNTDNINDIMYSEKMR